MNKIFGLFIGIYLVSFAGLNAQVDTLQNKFPYSWEGIWKGELNIYNVKGLAQSLPMELHILPIDSSENLTWTIIYGEDKEEGARNYELQILDGEKGKYIIDEKNSILLEGHLLGNKFFQRFEVMGSLLLTAIEPVSETELVWEIISGSLEPLSTTGGQTFEGQEIPPVRGYDIKVRQVARLQKQLP